MSEPISPVIKKTELVWTMDMGNIKTMLAAPNYCITIVMDKTRQWDI